MARSEAELLSLLARGRELRVDIALMRPAIAAVDRPWDDALRHLDDALSSLGLGIYLSTESMADDDAIEAGDMQRNAEGDVVPIPQDGRR